MNLALRNLFCASWALFLVAVGSTPAWAIWAPVPLEVLVDESFIIVAGKVIKVEKAGFAINNRNFDVATIEVSETLKIWPHLNHVKQIRLFQPSAGGIAVSTDLRSTVGQTGVWLLIKQPERDGYVVKHPSQFQPMEEKEKIAKLVAARKKLAGGKPVNGLQARAELIEQAVAGGPTFYEVRLSVKNVSDKPIILFDYTGAQPFKVEWTGPAGKQHESKHYEWLKRSDIAAANESNVIKLLPDTIHFIGPQSRDSGVYFQSQSDRPAVNENVAEPGEHKIVLSYTNQEDKPVAGVTGVWVGTVPANEITFTVK